MDNNKGILSNLKFYGLPWQMALISVALVFWAMYAKVLPTDLGGSIAACLALAIVFNEIGERLPIWNSYIGGGLLMVFFGTAVLTYYKVIPVKYVESINLFISGKTGFLSFFILFLISGSILALDRDILVKSFVGYIPAILGGLVLSFAFGVAGGLFFGIAPMDVVIKYALPIMGGGNGAGAVPLSQIYEQVTGDAAANYYSFAIIILTIANIFCIFAGALLNKLGDLCPRLTGDKASLLRGAENLAKEDEKVEVKIQDLGAAVMITVTAYTVGILFNKIILPKVFGAAIHQFAYMIIFVVVLAAAGVVPKNIRAAAKRLQNFFATTMGIVIMVGMGVDFDIAELATIANFQNCVIALLIVAGAIVGSAVVGYAVGFYPVDAAITAGLCMANRGGNGDIAVLGASKRMGLIAYAQLSSRLGGGIVLIIASFVFSFFLKAVVK